MLNSKLAVTLFATCAAAGLARADRAPAGPDYQRAPAHPAERALATSDGRDAIDPTEVIGFGFDSTTKLGPAAIARGTLPVGIAVLWT